AAARARRPAPVAHPAGLVPTGPTVNAPVKEARDETRRDSYAALFLRQSAALTTSDSATRKCFSDSGSATERDSAEIIFDPTFYPIWEDGDHKVYPTSV